MKFRHVDGEKETKLQGRSLEGQDRISLLDGKLRKRVELLKKLIYEGPEDGVADIDPVKELAPDVVIGWYMAVGETVSKETGVPMEEIRSAINDTENYQDHDSQMVRMLVKSIAAELPLEGRPAALLELLSIINAPAAEENEKGLAELHRLNDELKEKHGIDIFNLNDEDFHDFRSCMEISKLKTLEFVLSAENNILTYAAATLIVELMDTSGSTTTDLENALAIFTSMNLENFHEVHLPDFAEHPLFISLMKEVWDSPDCKKRLKNLGFDRREVSEMNKSWGWGLDLE
jgi:hypothetical protein